jgi:FkbM family methyltransferase
LNNSDQRHTGVTAAVEAQDFLVPIAPPRPRVNQLSRILRFLGRVREYCNELGFPLGLRWYCVKVLARLRVPGTARIRIKPPDVCHAVAVRMFPSSDDFVFDQLFIRHEYGPVCDQLQDAKFILDLGANVGYASAIFASRYPSARILAVEPDPGNYRLCVQNLEPYGNRVKTLLGAVWANRSRLALARGTYCDGREWATQVVETQDSNNAEVEAWDVSSLLDMAQQKEADLLKIDIEGSEAEVFASNTATWLPRVRNICIELHDQRCREIFFRALRGFHYEHAEFREFTLCLNLRRAV